MSIAVIKPQKLAELSKEVQQIDLIDVRTPVEYRELHVEFARNVPLDQLDPAALMQARNGSGNEPLYVICRSGSRGQQACEKFVKAGFANVVNIEGGTLACVEAGLPVIRGKKAISLEGLDRNVVTNPKRKRGKRRKSNHLARLRFGLVCPMLAFCATLRSRPH